MNKKWLVIVSFIVVSFNAKAVDWPKDPVVGIIGASFASCEAPPNSPLFGIGLAGCSFEGLDVGLIRNRFLQAQGFTVQNKAAGGSYSYDVPGTGWQGYVSQFNELVTRTAWPFDGENRLKVLVVSIMNDCLHSILCTPQEMEDGLIQNILTVVNQAEAMGVPVLVNAYPDWEDLDLAMAAQVYGLPVTISESDYHYLQALHKTKLETHPNVIYVEAWQGNFSTIDGLHPDKRSVKNASRRIAKEIFRL